MTSCAIPLDAFEKPKSKLWQFPKVHFLAFTISCLAVLTVPNTATAFVIVVQQGINCYGSNNTTDSYNSANPTQSTNGQYDPTKVSTNGDIACLSGLAQLGVAKINGALFLGPNASCGLTNGGAISGGVYSNLQYVLPEASLPSTNWLPSLSTNIVIDTVVYSYAFLPVASRGATAYYSISGPSSSVYVGSNQDIALLLSGNAGLGFVRVAQNGKLTIYIDSPSFTLNGHAMVDSGNPANLSLYGTTNNTQITFGGNASFTGTIYAPQADFKLLGGGTSVYDFVGTSVTRSLSLYGNFNFHFDENLQQLDLCSPQIVAQPQDQSIVSGQDATFNVSARGVVSYQWLFNGTNIPGATGSSLTITNATASNGGNYSVTIASPWGIQTSTQALLTVLQPPIIDTQPANAAGLLGGGATFVVSAHGLEPLYYQWRASRLPVNVDTSDNHAEDPLERPRLARA